MKLHWTERARWQRHKIVEYIAQDNIVAAITMDECFDVAADRLVDFPKLGKPGDLSGTRELTVHPSYRLIYEVDRHEVRILALIHTAQQWPPLRE